MERFDDSEGDKVGASKGDPYVDGDGVVGW